MKRKFEPKNKKQRLPWIGAIVAVCISVGFPGCRKNDVDLALGESVKTTDNSESTASTDFVGNLGGMKVRIPRSLAEFVEYDRDPGIGEDGNTAPKRSFESNLRSFGMTLRYPDMRALETIELRSHYKAHQLDSSNPWVSVSVNSGEFYPRMGSKANEGLAKKLWEKSEFWFANYAPAPELDLKGLKAYVVSGLDPKTGQPGRESDKTDDIFIEKSVNDRIPTFISCGRTKVVGGVASCRMFFGLEPKANARIKVTFSKSLLNEWNEIKRLTAQRILAFESQM